MDPQTDEATKVTLCPQCGLGLSACACTVDSLPVKDPWIGKNVNQQYEIQALVARGGMGAVYRARHVHLGVNRAIKFIRSDIQISEIVYQRFKQEAHAVSGLSHPNIVAFYDYGIAEASPYVVMDLLQGQSLDTIIKADEHLSVKRSLEIFSQVASALQHAHSKGILHRDIKPSNIMIVKDDDGNERVKVLDFGIAKVQNSEESNRLTGTGEIFGSPTYMSPEQGRGESLDVRSDIYSLGCVIFEALNGKPPFIGNNAIETIMKHLNEKPPKLFTKKKGAADNSPLGHLKSIIPKIEPFDPVTNDLEAMVARCLEKDPTVRYSSMRELEDDLKRLSYGERLLGLQQELGRRRQFELIAKIYKYALIAFAILLVPGAFLLVNLDKSWNRQLQAVLEDPDHAVDQFQQFIADLPKDDRYERNRAFLRWNQAQILRTSSGGDPAILKQAILKYSQALEAAQKESALRLTNPSGVTQHLAADCLEGLANSYMVLAKRDPSQANRATEFAEKAYDMRKRSTEAKPDEAESVALAETEELLASTLPNDNRSLSRKLHLLNDAERLVRAYTPKGWLHASILVDKAHALIALGQKQEALALLKEALTYRLTIYDSDDPHNSELFKEMQMLGYQPTQR